MPVRSEPSPAGGAAGIADQVVARDMKTPYVDVGSVDSRRVPGDDRVGQRGRAEVGSGRRRQERGVAADGAVGQRGRAIVPVVQAAGRNWRSCR